MKLMSSMETRTRVMRIIGWMISADTNKPGDCEKVPGRVEKGFFNHRWTQMEADGRVRFGMEIERARDGC